MKLLTIAIPTYNRGEILKKSIIRLLNEIKGFENKINILISDNCSNDETKNIVKKIIDNGNSLDYNCNAKNLGMDGNFIYCFKNAKSKYVWLLGDDDLIKKKSLKKIVKLLENYNPGLLHLNKQNDKKILNSNFKIFKNKTEFINQISFWITFISSNIVKTKYVESVKFENYLNTYFTLIPVYLNAIKSSKQNVYLYEHVLEDPLDQKRNGGYNIFEVFSINYLKILKEYRNDFGYVWFEKEKFRLFKFFFNNWIRRLIRDKKTDLNFKTDNWLKNLLINYWYEPYFYLYLIKILILKR